MKNIKGKIVGIQKGVSKKGNKYCILNVTQEFDTAMLENGSCGNQATQYFLDDELSVKASPDLIGKNVLFHTVFAGGKTVLCDFSV